MRARVKSLKPLKRGSLLGLIAPSIGGSGYERAGGPFGGSCRPPNQPILVMPRPVSQHEPGTCGADGAAMGAGPSLSLAAMGPTLAAGLTVHRLLGWQHHGAPSHG